VAQANGSNGKKKKNLSPEVRQAASDRAKKLHAEGKLGGAKFGRMGGRPRKKRASETVAEAAVKQANREDIVRVFEDAVADSQPIGVRLKGAEAWLAIEREERKLSLQEDEFDAKQHSRDELVAILADKLTSGPAAEVLRAKLAVSEAELHEAETIEDAEIVDEVDEDDGLDSSS
jgi:hypothetical protein